MGRKRKTDYPVAGRPPKSPVDKVGISARALVTVGVAEAIVKDANRKGIPDPDRGYVASDILRYYIWLGLEKAGLLDARLVPEDPSDTRTLRDDETFRGLREKGLV